MKFKDITNKTKADLEKILSEKREALRQFRFAGAGSKSKNVREGRTIRKNIAQILTAINKIK